MMQASQKGFAEEKNNSHGNTGQAEGTWAVRKLVCHTLVVGRQSDQGRASVWSVAQKWWPWYYACIFVLTIAYTILTAHELAGGPPEGIALAIAVAEKSASVIPLIVLCAMFFVTGLDLSGGFIMVTYRFLYDRWIKPQRERLQQEAREQAWAEARAEVAEAHAKVAEARAEAHAEVAEARAEAHAEVAEARAKAAEQQRLWEDWLRRREEAERHNLPFHEAPPKADCIDVAPDK